MLSDWLIAASDPFPKSVWVLQPVARHCQQNGVSGFKFTPSD